LQLIEKNGKHLLKLINDVLDMAKIESGRMSLALEEFDLGELLEDVLETTRPLARARDLYLKQEVSPGSALRINADRFRLRQILLNLVGNSIKFTEKGGVVIRAERMEDKALVSVKDTGIGIPPEKLEAIFEAFSQVDSSTTRKAGGTGLGLPISRRLVEMHGGRLWAESSGVHGEGAAFWMELPCGGELPGGGVMPGDPKPA
jgi:signal transduction histidine kinase